MRSGGNEYSDLGVDANKKQSAKPSRRDEKIIIAKFIDVASLCKEIPGRKYSRKMIYENMINIKTKFCDQEVEKKSRWLDDAMTEQERQLSIAVQRLFESNDNTNGDQSLTNTNPEVAVEMDFELIGFIDNVEYGNEDDSAKLSSTPQLVRPTHA